jgi:hypothetical protein
MKTVSPISFGLLRTLLRGAALILLAGQPINIAAARKGLIVLMWGLAFASVSATGQTVLSNADLTAFATALAAGGTVTLDFDGTITLSSCLSITNSVTVDGSGHAVTISGGSNSEIFAVATNAALVLRTLTVANGLSTNGAIANDGFLLVSNSSFIQNSAIGVSGGGQSPPSAGTPGVGGAIYNVGSTIVADCTFSGNSAVGGNGAFDDETTTGGADAQGGAIFNSGTIIVTNSTFFQNQSTGGIGGEGVPGEFEATGPGGLGGNGCGGALYSAAGSAIVVNSTFFSNSAAGGAGGTGGSGEVGLPGEGDWNGGNGGIGGNGFGGAIWLSNGVLSLTNVTFATNTSSGGPGGKGGAGYFGGPGNSGMGGTNGLAGAAFGAAAANLGGTFIIKNTLFCAYSNTTNFYGQRTDLGYNLASDYSPSFSAPTSRNGVDPMLGTFGYYGGNTQTIPLLYGSPAINGGDPRAFPPVDQRGRHRPSGPAPDIGAFEYTFPTFSNLSFNEAGAQLVLLGEADDICFIDVSSNLLDWTTLSTNSLDVTNAIEILDTTVSTSGGRYYRARLE